MKIKIVKRCHSCGAILQDRLKNSRGYISPNIFNSEEYLDSILYCDGCYKKIKQLNQINDTQNLDNETVKILKDAKASDSTIVYVINSCLFNGINNQDVVKYIKKLNVIVLVTHLDLFPKRYSRNKILNFISSRFEKDGIIAKYIIPFTKYEQVDTKKIYEIINNTRKGHDVYIIGSNYSGKTTIINNLLKVYKNKSQREVRTINYPSTKAKVLEIPFTNSSFMYELKGFSNKNSTINLVEKSLTKILLPENMIKDNRFRMSINDSFLIGGLAYISLIKGDYTFMRFYSSEKVQLLKIKDNSAETSFLDNLEKRKIKPVSNNFQSFSDFDLIDVTLEKNGKFVDISLEGLGWLTLSAKGQTLRIMLPKGINITCYESKVK